MAKFKLPKSVRRYVQPRDAAHEARLYNLWRMYRRSLKEERDGDELSIASELEEAILGQVFGIPKEKWSNFRPKEKRATQRDVYEQFFLLVTHKSRPKKQKHTVNKPQVRQKQSTIIIRRPRPNGTQ